MKLHPLETTQRIRDDYTRYLKTIYFFRNPELRRQFWQALTQPGYLVRGPLLEAATPYRRGRSIRQMVEQDILSPGFVELCSDALPLDRPMYYIRIRPLKKW